MCQERKGPFLGFRTERSLWIGEAIIPQEVFPGGSDGKESACSIGNPGSIPDSGRSPGEGNGNPLQYSRLENPMDRGAWWLESTGRKESDMTEQLTHALQGALCAPFRGRALDPGTLTLAWTWKISKGFQET